MDAWPLKRFRAWCAAIEAEAYSSLGYAPSCLDALERTRDASEEAFLVPDVYATGFTRSRLASYEGSCYLRLHLPERALPALQQAVALIDPGAVRKRSRLLTYMGEAHALLGETQQAYTYAHQALDLTQHTQSLDILRQVQALSRNLSRGKTSLDDSSLYQRIQEMQLVFAGMRG